MKKLFMLMLLSAPIFCMEQRSIPDNEMDEKYKEFQGKYNPTINFFSITKSSAINTKQPLHNIAATVNAQNIAQSIQKNIDENFSLNSSQFFEPEPEHEQRRVVSYSFGELYTPFPTKKYDRHDWFRDFGKYCKDSDK